MEIQGPPTAPLTFGAANLKLLSDSQLLQHLRTIAAAFPSPAAVGIGMAGARTAADQDRLRTAAKKVWPTAACVATHDLETALAAADANPLQTRILVLSGTGSCCYGRDARGRTARTGGWGHLLGDQGSGYDIAIQALRGVVEAWDHTGRWSLLGRSLLEFLHLNEPDLLVGWIHAANKGAIAALAPVVFTAAARRDPIAKAILHQAAHHLATAAIACARRLAPRGHPTQFVFAGGVLLGQPGFARAVRQRILGTYPKGRIIPLHASGAVGAARLALDTHLSQSPIPGSATAIARPTVNPDVAPGSPVAAVKPGPAELALIPGSSRLSPTEERNPKSIDLDRLRPGAAIDLMLLEDSRIPAALRREKPHLVRALRLVHQALSTGGRLFYVGAGTSGRLGVLDASECPPTFRTPPDWIQGVIAGGAEAVFRSVEGAEDDVAAGSRAIEFRQVGRRDVVVGIAASGRTPFVWGALGEARRRGAATLLVCFNPHLVFAPGQRPDVVIAPRIGPEILTGSTRLKAGTATKLILNLLTTLTMVRLGKVVSNLMVDLNPANAKLRDRAIRITRDLTGAEADLARASLIQHGWIVSQAIKALRKRRPNHRPT